MEYNTDYFHRFDRIALRLNAEVKKCFMRGYYVPDGVFYYNLHPLTRPLISVNQHYYCWYRNQVGEIICNN